MMKKTVLYFVAAIFVTMTFHSAMATNSDADVRKVDDAWQEVERESKAMLSRILARVPDGDATEHYHAYKNMIAMIMDMYTYTLYRSSNSDYPEYLPFGTGITSSCSNSTATRYGHAYIEPGASYRVWGTRGNALELDIQQWRSFGGVAETYPISAKGEFAQKTFTAQGIKYDKDGHFEFILSPTKPDKGQWWKLEDGVKVLQFKDFYADYSEEAIPPVYRLEKIGPKNRGVTTLPANEAAERLHLFAKTMKSFDICFRGVGKLPMHSFINKTFSSNPDDKKSGSGQQMDQTYYLTEYNLSPGQALIVEWEPPENYLYWNIELNTRVGQYFNFGARQVDLTSKMTHIDQDGKIRFVFSHEDPHMANWLDLDGNKRGLIWLRCKRCSDNSIPATRVVATDQITENLPPGTKMVTDVERQEALDQRRRHYLSRYRL